MKYFLTIIVFFSFLKIYAQEEDLSKQRNIFFQNEKTWGYKINTNGWGVDYRYGVSQNEKNKNLLEIGINRIKHPKEYKITSYNQQNFFSSNTFVYGRDNLCYDLKIGVGRQTVLFDKKEVGTVQIRLIYFAGVDLALLKPIYYEIIIDLDFNTEIERYKPSHQPGLIVGQEPFTKGLLESKFNPGLYFKLGTSFEHSKSANFIQSLEFGAEAYIFLYKLNIMAEVSNPQFVLSLFMSYRLGSIIQKKNKAQDLKF